MMTLVRIIAGILAASMAVLVWMMGLIFVLDNHGAAIECRVFAAAWPVFIAFTAGVASSGKKKARDEQ